MSQEGAQITGSGMPDDNWQGEQRPANASETAAAVERDAEGLPLFRPAAAGKVPPIDLATALRLEQETLALQDLEATLLAEWASPEDEAAFSDL